MIEYRIVDLKDAIKNKDSLLSSLYELQVRTCGAEQQISFEMWRAMLVFFRFCALAEEQNKPICAIYFSKSLADEHSHNWICVGFIGRESLLKVVLSGVMQHCFSLVRDFARQQNAYLWVPIGIDNKKMCRFVQKAGFSLLQDSNVALEILSSVGFLYERFDVGPPPSFVEPFTKTRNLIFTLPEFRR